MADGPPRKASVDVDGSLAAVLDDLCFRFLNNLPASEYESFERLFFAVENAHWFYEDFHREHDRRLPKLQLREFSALVFRHSPVLRPHAGNVDALTAQFRSYKKDVPVCGAALLNPEMTKVLLVKGWGPGGKWGFPKGKIAKDESELNAAIREVREETGFDFSRLVDGHEEPATIDSYTTGRLCRIFIVHNVPEDTEFRTLTRKEIAKIQWVPIGALPDARGESTQGGGLSSTSQADLQQFQEKNFSKAWLDSRYTPKLRSHINRQRQHASCGADVAMSSNGSIAIQDAELRSSSGTIATNSASQSQSDRVQSKKNEGKKRRANDRQGACSRAGPAMRDAATFGLDDGPITMTDQERNDLFRTYVEEADKRAVEMGLGDDCWPVSYVTSKDLEPRTSAISDCPTGTDSNPSSGTPTDHLNPRLDPGTRAKECIRFRFNRNRILECLS
jgi:mRNA-decapping enzyme subunit 2